MKWVSEKLRVLTLQKWCPGFLEIELQVFHWAIRLWFVFNWLKSKRCGSKYLSITERLLPSGWWGLPSPLYTLLWLMEQSGRALYMCCTRLLWRPACMEDEATSRVRFHPNHERMDLNQPPAELNIRFTLRDIKFTIRTKVNCRLRLIALFGEEGYQLIIRNPQPLMLGEVGPNHVGIFMLV